MIYYVLEFQSGTSGAAITVVNGTRNAAYLKYPAADGGSADGDRPQRADLTGTQIR